MRSWFCILWIGLAGGLPEAGASADGRIADLRSAMPLVRREAAAWLGRAGDRAAVPMLIEALSDEQKDVRREAAKALGALKDDRASHALAGAMKDEDINVRFYAAYALGEIRDPAASAALLGALRDPEWCVRNQAAWSLRELHDPSVAASAAASLREPGADAAAVGWLLKGLGAADVAALTPPVKLGAHWSFDDRDATEAKDLTGNGNDGKISGATPAEGRIGAALALDGRGGIELGKPRALPTADQPITVMAWIKSGGTSGVVVARGGAFTGFSLYIKDGIPKFGIRRTAQDAAAAIAAGARPVTGEWTHLAGAIKNECVELYVNGRLEASAKTAGCLPGNCGQGMEIGFDAGNSAVEITDHFTGLIDEVKVFQQALDADAIAAEAGAGAKP